MIAHLDLFFLFTFCRWVVSHHYTSWSCEKLCWYLLIDRLRLAWTGLVPDPSVLLTNQRRVRFGCLKIAFYFKYPTNSGFIWRSSFSIRNSQTQTKEILPNLNWINQFPWNNIIYLWLDLLVRCFSCDFQRKMSPCHSHVESWWWKNTSTDPSQYSISHHPYITKQ